MAEKLKLDNEVHELKLGKSFDQGSGVAFHSIRYDFKPESLDSTKASRVEVEKNNSVTVTVPHVQSSGTSHTVFKGNKKPVQKECVLIIDHDTGEFTLEKLSNAIQLKKTRPKMLDTNGGGRRKNVIMNKSQLGPSYNIHTAKNNGHMVTRSSTRQRKAKSGNCDDFKTKLQEDLLTCGQCEALEYCAGHVALSKIDDRDLPCANNETLDNTSLESEENQEFVNQMLKSVMVKFAKEHIKQIQSFLQSHRLDESRRPFLKSFYDLHYFERTHSDIYANIIKRLAVPEPELKSLTDFICYEYSDFLTYEGKSFKMVQRLEDTIDFVLDLYKKSKES